MPAEEILRKLRVKPGDRVAIVDAPDSYQPVIAALPATVDIHHDLQGQFDFVHYFVAQQSALETKAPELKAALKPSAILWISYPKGKAIPTDLNRDRLREIAERAGLQTVAMIAIDEVWSAMRCKPV